MKKIKEILRIIWIVIKAMLEAPELTPRKINEKWEVFKQEISQDFDCTILEYRDGTVFLFKDKKDGTKFLNGGEYLVQIFHRHEFTYLDYKLYTMRVVRNHIDKIKKQYQEVNDDLRIYQSQYR